MVCKTCENGQGKPPAKKKPLPEKTVADVASLLERELDGAVQRHLDCARGAEVDARPTFGAWLNGMRKNRGRLDVRLGRRVRLGTQACLRWPFLRQLGGDGGFDSACHIGLLLQHDGPERRRLDDAQRHVEETLLKETAGARPRRANSALTPQQRRTLGLFVAVEPTVSAIPGAGVGLRAMRTFLAGDDVTYFDGEEIDYAEARRRKEAGQGTHLRRLLFGTSVIDGIRGEDVLQNMTKYIGRGGASISNHEEKRLCNADFDHYLNAVVIKATRTIRRGEEIFVNYGKDYWKT